MITCPNCNHQNPDGALQCEACYTPLPALAHCPNCNATIQADASFCGQCGTDLRDEASKTGSVLAEPDTTESSAVEADPDAAGQTQNFLVPAPASPQSVGEPIEAELPAGSEFETFTGQAEEAEEAEASEETSAAFITEPSLSTPPAAPPAAPSAIPPVATQLQTISSRLRHVQTNTPIEIPRQLSVVRIGKPNEHTPPDIDVSGFPNSEIVSRAHANLRAEGDTYYLEDVGSSNGTYINGLPLPTGNRHRLRPGDRIALGKGDKVSFLFESSS